MKRMYFDIEVSPNVGLFWRPGFNQRITFDQIVQERKIICICWKWEGEPVTHSVAWDKNMDDKKMLIRFSKEADLADEIVGHYVNGFDMPWFRTRCLYHGLNPLPAYKTVDTKAMAAKNFLFNSNALNYIGQFLGEGKKIDTDYDMWKDITLRNDRKQLRRMVDYCIQDVVLLEKVYKRLQAWTPAKTHSGVLSGLDKWSCPRCASENVKKSKTRVTAAGTIQHQMVCRDCGGYFSISNTAHSQYLERRKPVAKRAHAKKR